MSHWTLTPERLAEAVQRDAQDSSAALLPDGETVLAPDDDMGFTVSLEAWTQAGGRHPSRAKHFIAWLDLPPGPNEHALKTLYACAERHLQRGCLLPTIDVELPSHVEPFNTHTIWSRS